MPLVPALETSLPPVCEAEDPLPGEGQRGPQGPGRRQGSSLRQQDGAEGGSTGSRCLDSPDSQLLTGLLGERRNLLQERTEHEKKGEAVKRPVEDGGQVEKRGSGLAAARWGV